MCHPARFISGLNGFAYALGPCRYVTPCTQFKSFPLKLVELTVAPEPLAETWSNRGFLTLQRRRQGFKGGICLSTRQLRYLHLLTPVHSRRCR